MHVSQAAAGAGSRGATTKTTLNAGKPDWALQAGNMLVVACQWLLTKQGKQPESCRFAGAKVSPSG